MQYVVLMVAQRNLVASQFLSFQEQLLAPVPRTEEAWRLAVVGGHVEACGHEVELHAETLAEVFQISCVALISDVLHPDMYGVHLNLRTVYRLLSA